MLSGFALVPRDERRTAIAQLLSLPDTPGVAPSSSGLCGA
jgi:hypothetical protein